MYTYIYGVYNENKELRYIGRSYDPYGRRPDHRNKLHNVGDVYGYIQIIDIVTDPEYKIIREYKDKGYKLLNKRIPLIDPKYKIGDIVDEVYTVGPKLYTLENIYREYLGLFNLADLKRQFNLYNEGVYRAVRSKNPYKGYFLSKAL